MKKTLFFILTLVVAVFVIISCDGRSTYPLAQSRDSIDKIELVDFSIYRYNTEENFLTEPSLMTIDPSMHDTFLDMFFTVNCREHVFHSQQMIEGPTIRITYMDGAYELICAGDAYYCDENKRSQYRPYGFDRENFTNFFESWR